FARTRGVSAPAPVGPFSPERLAEVGNVKAIGRLLFTDYLFPFEVTSVLLFVAVIGAVILARRSP
ncbi:MAG: NADH-quinone oxidoreductase subunit J, partial [Nitrospinota bacterium]